MTAPRFSVVEDIDTEAFWFLGTLSRIRLGMDSTLGVFDMVEILHPEGYASPLHVHQDDNEVFFVLEGTLRGVCNDEEVTADTGSTIWLPKGSVHGYAAAGSTPLRILAMTVPGNFSGFVRDAGTPALQPELPPSDLPVDFEKVGEIAAQYGISIVGPPVGHLIAAD